MLPATPQRTAERRRLAPPPPIAVGSVGRAEDAHPGGDLENGEDPPQHEGEGEDADELLPVVAAVAERHERCRENLHPPEDPPHLPRVRPPEHPVDREHQRDPGREAEKGREQYADEDLPP